MKKIICRIKGHDYKPTGKILEGEDGVYYKDKLQFPNKEYKCSRCGQIAIGNCLSKEDLEAVMGFALLAQAQHEYDMNTLPQRVSQLENEIIKLKKKQKGIVE